jgi:hypothetical protein
VAEGEERIGFGVMWHKPCGRNEICKIIRIICGDIQRRVALANIRGEIHWLLGEQDWRVQGGICGALQQE